MWKSIFLSLLLPVFAAAPAWAGDLTVMVTSKGAPVRDAVVMVYPGGHAAAPVARDLEMKQIRMQFDPYLLVVPQGSRVSFPNTDAAPHFIFSNSPAKKFLVKVGPHGVGEKILFDRAGPVEVLCNIHPNMLAYIYVADTALAVKTDAAGAARLPNVPGGSAIIKVWHPYLKGANLAEAKVAVPGSGAVRQTVAVDLRGRPVPKAPY